MKSSKRIFLVRSFKVLSQIFKNLLYACLDFLRTLYLSICASNMQAVTQSNVQCIQEKHTYNLAISNACT